VTGSSQQVRGFRGETPCAFRSSPPTRSGMRTTTGCYLPVMRLQGMPSPSDHVSPPAMPPRTTARFNLGGGAGHIDTISGVDRGLPWLWCHHLWSWFELTAQTPATVSATVRRIQSTGSYLSIGVVKEEVAYLVSTNSICKTEGIWCHQLASSDHDQPSNRLLAAC
jgi:hypothetical protein